ncbi:hypothetical protein ES703_46153 [subsurface metagenome]
MAEGARLRIGNATKKYIRLTIGFIRSNTMVCL